MRRTNSRRRVCQARSPSAPYKVAAHQIRAAQFRAEQIRVHKSACTAKRRANSPSKDLCCAIRALQNAPCKFTPSNPRFQDSRRRVPLFFPRLRRTRPRFCADPKSQRAHQIKLRGFRDVDFSGMGTARAEIATLFSFVSILVGLFTFSSLELEWFRLRAALSSATNYRVSSPVCSVPGSSDSLRSHIDIFEPGSGMAVPSGKIFFGSRGGGAAQP